MRARWEGRRHRQSFSATCEGLEGRALLSAAALDVPASGIHAAEVRAIHAAAKSSKPTLVLHGQVTGTIGAIQTNLTNINTLIAATGKVEGLPGEVVFAALQETTLNKAKTRVTVANGSGSVTPLSASTGSYMLVVYKGGGPVSHKGVMQTLQIHGSVTGGKGAYAGVSSGAFSGVATLNPVTGAFSMKFTLTVKPVG
jgi:hypothetical protein